MDSVASLLPAGAGRILDFIWPDPNQANGSPINQQMRSRNGYGVSAVTGAAVNIGAGTTTVAAIRQGATCVQLNSGPGAGVGTQKLFYPGFPVPFRTSRGLFSPLTDDLSVYRFVINMAGSGTAADVGGDYGFELVRYGGGVGTPLVGGNIPGIGVRVRDTNTVELLVNGANGLQTVALTVAPFDTTLFHSYDLRLFAPTNTTDAFLTLRIDNGLIPIAAANSNWGGATNLPAAPLNATLCGFVPSIISAAGVAANSLFVQQVHLIAAPTELMTL